MKPQRSHSDNSSMDPTQIKIIELIREVHLLAIKEVERLNMRIASSSPSEIA